MLIVLLALFASSLLDFNNSMSTKATNCKSLKVPSKDRCAVCKYPGNNEIRKKWGRKCLTASRAEQTSIATSDEFSCSPCEPSSAFSSFSSCSCCSSGESSSAGAVDAAFFSAAVPELSRLPSFGRFSL